MKRIIPHVPPEDRCKLHEGCATPIYWLEGLIKKVMKDNVITPKVVREGIVKRNNR